MDLQRYNRRQRLKQDIIILILSIVTLSVSIPYATQLWNDAERYVASSPSSSSKMNDLLGSSRTTHMPPKECAHPERAA